jgi:hypothetical protein
MSSDLERTKAAAFEALMAEYRKLRSEGAIDDKTGAIVSENMIKEVLSTAWESQFEENRSACRSTLESIVSDSVATVLEGVEE